MESPADLLKRTRLELGVSQRQLADAIGASPSLVCRVERGADARLSTWIALFEGLGYRLRCEAELIDDELQDWHRDQTEVRRRRQKDGLCYGKDRFD